MKIVLIGSGNIAYHLGNALVKAGHRILQVSGRNPKTTGELSRRFNAEAVHGLASLTEKADIYLIAVPDREIAKVACSFPYTDKIIVHTSGSVALDVFPKEYSNAGCFYPLQTLTKGKSIRYQEMPICIEGRTATVNSKLKRLAGSISETVVETDSDQRAWMHLAAVIVNNFSNHLFHVAENLMEKHGLDFRLLHPLILETARKATTMSPAAAQTGPARRGDAGILRKHLGMLGRNSRKGEIYRILSESIESMDAPRL